MIEKKMIYSPTEVPKFASEDEEVEFWDTHDFGEDFWSKLKPPSGKISELLRRHREQGAEAAHGPPS